MRSKLLRGGLRSAFFLYLSCSATALAVSAPAVPAEDDSLKVDAVLVDDDFNFVLSADGSSVAYAVTQQLSAEPGVDYGFWLWTPDGETEILIINEEVELLINGISGDGTVVVGTVEHYKDDRSAAYIWDAEQGTRSLGFLPGGNSTTATALSQNGEVVVGSAFGVRYSKAFRWEDEEIEVLDHLGRDVGEATAVSADGRVIAGYAGWGTSVDHVGMVWHDGKATSFSGGGTVTEVRAISADGSTVVGEELDENYDFSQAYYWRDGKMVFLGTLGGTDSYSVGVSGDGRVIIGSSGIDEMDPFAEEAFRWTEETGMVSLGSFGTGYSTARAISEDGRVIVGSSDHDELEFTAYRWTEENGMETIADVLTEGGVDVEGWEFWDAGAVSADGGTIVGTGYTDDVERMMWIARCLDDSCVVLNDVDTGKSFAGLAGTGGTANAFLDQNFDQVGTIMGNGGAGSHASLGGSFDSDPTAAAVLTFSHEADDGLEGALSVGIAGIETLLPFDGRSFFSTGSVTASVGKDADTGFDWRLSGALAGLSGSIERGYLNGNTVESSTGTTSGLGAGAEIELGWNIADIAPATSLRPYLGASIASTSFAGYTETGGPFPATFGAFTVTQGVVRAGIEAEHRLTDAVSLEAGLAYVHRFTATPAITGTIPGVFALTVPGDTGAADWAELSLGLSLPVGEVGTLGATTMLRIPTTGAPSVVAGLTFTLPL